MNFIFLPSYNEWKNLPRTIEEIKKYLNKSEYKIVIIDDGSTDGTFDNCKKFFPDVDIIKHKKNLGIGGVFRSIISYIIEKIDDNSNLIIMEADGTSSPFLIPEMIKKLNNGWGVVIASRYKKGGCYKNFPLKRLILSKGANTLFRFIFPHLKVKDFTIFFRGYRTFYIKKTYRKYRDNFITSEGFCANIEFLIKLIKADGFKISEIPFIYDYRIKKGKSKLKIFKNLKEYSKFILEIFYFYYFSG